MGSRSGPKWEEYATAIRRKIDVAVYHLERLDAELATSRSAPVPIPVQAHFEGILYSFVAATDQLAAGLGVAYAISHARNLHVTVSRLPESDTRRQLSAWIETPIAKDIHDVRVLVTHHHYAKTPRGPGWVVQVPTRSDPYGGPRDLVEYGKRAIAHLQSLAPVVGAIDLTMRSQPDNDDGAATGSDGSNNERS